MSFRSDVEKMIKLPYSIPGTSTCLFFLFTSHAKLHAIINAWPPVGHSFSAPNGWGRFDKLISASVQNNEHNRINKTKFFRLVPKFWTISGATKQQGLIDKDKIGDDFESLLLLYRIMIFKFTLFFACKII